MSIDFMVFFFYVYYIWLYISFTNNYSLVYKVSITYSKKLVDAVTRPNMGGRLPMW